MIFLKCLPDSIFPDGRADIIRDRPEPFPAIPHTDPGSGRLQHLLIIHTVPKRNGIAQRDSQMAAHTRNRPSLIKHPVDQLAVHNSVCIRLLYGKLKCFPQKLLRLFQLFQRRAHNHYFIHRLSPVFLHRTDIEDLSDHLPPAQILTVPRRRTGAQILRSPLIHKSSAFTLCCAKHPALCKNPHRHLPLCLRHGAVIDHLPLTFDITSRTGNDAVKPVPQQRKEHAIAPPGAQTHIMPALSRLADCLRRRLRRLICARLRQRPVNIQKNCFPLHNCLLIRKHFPTSAHPLRSCPA